MPSVILFIVFLLFPAVDSSACGCVELQPDKRLPELALILPAYQARQHYVGVDNPEMRLFIDPRGMLSSRPYIRRDPISSCKASGV